VAVVDESLLLLIVVEQKEKDGERRKRMGKEGVKDCFASGGSASASYL
jgi:hypothetical protein